MFSSDSAEWETPRELFASLDEYFEFTLDPCGSEVSHMVSNYYNKEQNGLTRDWTGEVAFVNPPYGRKISRWIEKCATEYLNNGVEVVLLAPARTETRYWHNFIWPIAPYVLFLKGRLQFLNRTLPSYIKIYESLIKSPEPYGKWEAHLEAETHVKRSSAPYPSALVFYTYRILESDYRFMRMAENIGHLVRF